MTLFCNLLWFCVLIQAKTDSGQNKALPEKLPTVIAIVGAFIAMLVGLWFVFARLKEKQQGFGANALKALGLVLFLPTLVIIGSIKDFQAETLAALLGTVAGYVLSHSKDEDH